MWKLVLSLLTNSLTMLNKLVPSWEWKGGRAEEKSRNAEEYTKKQARIDTVSAPTERDTIDSLRRGEF